MDERKRIIEAGKEMFERKLVSGTWGNISRRIVENSQRFAITPSGIDYRKIDPGDMAIMNLKNEIIEGEKQPSSESPLHATIYRNRDDVNAIVHTHSHYASALACVRKDIPPIVEDMVQILGGRIETADYEMPGTEDLADSVLKALGDKNAALMPNHGAVALGRDITEALKAAEILEKSAKIFVLSSLVGEPHPLSHEDVETMKEMYKEYQG